MDRRARILFWIVTTIILMSILGFLLFVLPVVHVVLTSGQPLRSQLFVRTGFNLETPDDMQTRLLPWPQVVAHQVSLLATPSSIQTPLLTAKRVNAHIAPFAIPHPTYFSSVDIISPHVRVITDANNQNNWSTPQIVQWTTAGPHPITTAQALGALQSHAASFTRFTWKDGLLFWQNAYTHHIFHITHWTGRVDHIGTNRKVFFSTTGLLQLPLSSNTTDMTLTGIFQYNPLLKDGSIILSNGLIHVIRSQKPTLTIHCNATALFNTALHSLVILPLRCDMHDIAFLTGQWVSTPSSTTYAPFAAGRLNSRLQAHLLPLLTQLYPSSVPPLLSGDLSAALLLVITPAQQPQMIPLLQTSFTIENGALHGVDITQWLKALATNTETPLMTGSTLLTRFHSMNGNATLSLDNILTIQQIQLSNDDFKMTGNCSVNLTTEAMSGTFTITPTDHSSVQTMALRGTLTHPIFYQSPS